MRGLAVLALACAVVQAIGCGRQAVTSLGTNASCEATDAGLATDVCAAIGRLEAAPTLDGQLECGVRLEPLSPELAKGVGPMPAASFALAWRPDGLYVFVHVSKLPREPAPPEQEPFCGDSIHLFVDSDGRFIAPPAYDASGTMQLIARAPATDVGARVEGERRGPGDFVPWSSHYVVVPTDDGYALEAFLTAADLGLSGWTLGAAASIGWDLVVDVGGEPNFYGDTSTGCSHKRAEVPLRLAPNAMGSAANPHSNVEAFCTPTLR